jgi:Zn-dependent M28 family amino/carboxypeptidase
VREDLHQSVRLCFFNADAAGLVGSRAYAAALKATATPVTGVICCDMIGFNSDGARTFEVHAGCTDREVRDLSVPLAELVANGAASFGLPAPAQVFRGMIPAGGDDPGRHDPAIDRAGHAAFQEQGYPAVLVSEDRFPQLPGDRAAEVAVDADYAADITRAVSIAVTTLGSG